MFLKYENDGNGGPVLFSVVLKGNLLFCLFALALRLRAFNLIRSLGSSFSYDDAWSRETARDEFSV